MKLHWKLCFWGWFQGLHFRTSRSSTQQNPEPRPFHTRSWCIYQCETETWYVVQDTQSKSKLSWWLCISKPYIGLSDLRRSQWMMILHPCQGKKALSRWLPWGRGRSRFQVTSDGSRLKGPFVSEGVQQILWQLLASSGSWQSQKLLRYQGEPCRGHQRLCWVKTLCLDNSSFRRIWLKKERTCLQRILKQPKEKKKREERVYE